MEKIIEVPNNLWGRLVIWIFRKYLNRKLFSIRRFGRGGKVKKGAGLGESGKLTRNSKRIAVYLVRKEKAKVCYATPRLVTVTCPHCEKSYVKAMD